MPRPIIESHQKKPRKCLKCGKEFVSTWPGHRLCARCKSLKDVSVSRKYKSFKKELDP